MITQTLCIIEEGIANSTFEGARTDHVFQKGDPVRFILYSPKLRSELDPSLGRPTMNISTKVDRLGNIFTMAMSAQIITDSTDPQRQKVVENACIRVIRLYSLCHRYHARGQSEETTDRCRADGGLAMIRKAMPGCTRINFPSEFGPHLF